MITRLILGAVGLAVVLFVVLSALNAPRSSSAPGTTTKEDAEQRDAPAPSSEKRATQQDEPDESQPAVDKNDSAAAGDSVHFDVPFTAQAPSAQWGEDIYQYACEEASVLMAMRWVAGESLSQNEANAHIAALAQFQEENYGTFYDRSAEDTTQLIRDYYDYEGVAFKTGITSDDIKTALKRGRIVIIPVAGHVLANPHYTPPGPLIHMIVVIGYDAEANEFIAHDPGTRYGENFRYAEHVINEAIREYETGRNEPVEEVRKVMIEVRKTE